MVNAVLGIGFVLACLAAYFTIGVLYARSQAVKIYREQWAWHRKMWAYTPDEKIGEYAERETRAALRIKATFWPLEMLSQFFAGLSNGGNNLLMNPVYERRYKAEQLRRDAKTWEDVTQHPGSTPAEEKMAAELAKVLSEAAEREDIR
jgi:hypothetical protein